MRIFALTCLTAIAAVPLPAQAAGLVIDLLPGHPVYHEEAREAGVVMALSISPGDREVVDLQALCEELRIAADLAHDHGQVPLEVIFVVPYKGMAIEGYYLPADGAHGSGTLLRGEAVARTRLDDIVARAGLPAGILDETGVEHEISCELGEPAWLLRWEDIRPLGEDGPDPVIESAHRRFMAIYRSVVEQAMATKPAAKHSGHDTDRAAPGVSLTRSASAADRSPPAAALD